MKKIFNKRLFTATMGLVLLTVFNSCVKNRNLSATDFTQIQPVVELLVSPPLSATPKYHQPEVLNLLKPVVTERIYVNYAALGTAPTDITVTLALDQSGLTIYNLDTLIEKSYVTNYGLLANNAYTYNPTVVIKKGTQWAYTDISFYPSLVNTSLLSALSIKIASVSPSVTISANYAHYIYLLSVKSPYEAVYSLKGFTLRATDPVLTGYLGPVERTLLTQNANTVRMFENRTWNNSVTTQLAAPFGNPIYSIDPVTNAVTITSDAGAIGLPNTIINNPLRTSHYDPATRTIYAYGTWGGGPGVREMNDTLTYVRDTP